MITDMDNSQRDKLFDLYENPLNYGQLNPHSFRHQANNPLCGDFVQIDMVIDENHRVTTVKWHGHGCAISQAAASLLTEKVKGMTLDDIKQINQQQLLDLVGVPLSMMRIKCALLPLQALKNGLLDD